MSTAAPVAPLTLEQKIENAISDGGHIVELFVPAAAAAIDAGVAVEPIIGGLIKLLIGLFRHHTSAPSASAAKS